MGYILILLIFLSWLNLRSIKKAVCDMAYEKGKKRTNMGRFLDFMEDVHNENKARRKPKKKPPKDSEKKVQSNELSDINDYYINPDEDGFIPPPDIPSDKDLPFS